MDNTKKTSASLLSNDGKQALIVRCTNVDLDIYVATGNVVDSDSGVRVKLDQGSPRQEHWDRSDDYTALFSRNPKELLTELLNSNTMMFEWSPYEETPKVAVFETKGLPIKSCPVQ